MKYYFIAGLSLLFIQATFGQSIDFEQLLVTSQFSIAQPIERQFKVIKPIENDFINYQHAMRSRKTGLEIRYAVIPDKEKIKDVPSISAMIEAMNAASNEEEGIIVTKGIEKTIVQNKYHASWGSIYRFPPKRGFSDKSHCTMFALYATKKATVYVFFLYHKMTDKVKQEMGHLMGLIEFDE